MGIPKFQYQEMLARTEQNRQRSSHPLSDPVLLEIPLHNKIIEHCNKQWPRWKYIHANPSRKSTIGEGIQDFTIFAPMGRVFCIEVKTKNGKRTKEQLIWAAEMRGCGFEVHEIRSIEEFLNITFDRIRACKDAAGSGPNYDDITGGTQRGET